MKTSGEVPQMTHLHAQFFGYCVSCHRVKSVSVWSLSCPRLSYLDFEIVPISPYSVKMQENTDQKKLTFHAVCVLTCASARCSIPVYM